MDTTLQNRQAGRDRTGNVAKSHIPKTSCSAWNLLPLPLLPITRLSPHICDVQYSFVQLSPLHPSNYEASHRHCVRLPSLPLSSPPSCRPRPHNPPLNSCSTHNHNRPLSPHLHPQCQDTHAQIRKPTSCFILQVTVTTRRK